MGVFLYWFIDSEYVIQKAIYERREILLYYGNNCLMWFLMDVCMVSNCV